MTSLVFQCTAYASERGYHLLLSHFWDLTTLREMANGEWRTATGDCLSTGISWSGVPGLVWSIVSIGNARNMGFKCEWSSLFEQQDIKGCNYNEAFLMMC